MKTKFNKLLYLFLPKKLLTWIGYQLASRRLGFLTTLSIRIFCRVYRVNLEEALYSDLRSYSTFNAFFSRALLPGKRPISTKTKITVPADGLLTEHGTITSKRLFSVKGKEYSLAALLAADQSLLDEFSRGVYSIIYLSPRDYHRVHMPCDGRLVLTISVPGNLYPVNQSAAAAFPHLLTTNERLICVFETPFGQLVQILVGAMIVGSIRTVWHGVWTPPRFSSIVRTSYADKNLYFLQGDEMAAFELGSTVITLFSNPDLQWIGKEASRRQVRVGEPFLTHTV